jgi:hypothetical protein
MQNNYYTIFSQYPIQNNMTHPQEGEKAIRYLELLGVVVVIISLFLPFGRIPIFDRGEGDIFGGFYWSEVSLSGFLTSSSGAFIAAILLGIGILMIVTRIGGQGLVLIGTTSIILIAFAEVRLFPLDLGISVLTLAIGSGLCSAKLILELLKE